MIKVKIVVQQKHKKKYPSKKLIKNWLKRILKVFDLANIQ